MIRLKNIKKNNYIGECDIFPEDSKQAGHIIVNLDSGKIDSVSLPLGYEWCVNHVYHAVDSLTKILKNDEFPNEQLVMWN